MPAVPEVHNDIWDVISKSYEQFPERYQQQLDLRRRDLIESSHDWDDGSGCKASTYIPDYSWTAIEQSAKRVFLFVPQVSLCRPPQHLQKGIVRLLMTATGETGFVCGRADRSLHRDHIIGFVGADTQKHNGCYVDDMNADLPDRSLRSTTSGWKEPAYALLANDHNELEYPLWSLTLPTIRGMRAYLSWLVTTMQTSPVLKCQHASAGFLCYNDLCDLTDESVDDFLSSQFTGPLHTLSSVLLFKEPVFPQEVTADSIPFMEQDDDHPYDRVDYRRFYNKTTPDYDYYFEILLKISPSDSRYDAGITHELVYFRSHVPNYAYTRDQYDHICSSTSSRIRILTALLSRSAYSCQQFTKPVRIAPSVLIFPEVYLKREFPRTHQHLDWAAAIHLFRNWTAGLGYCLDMTDLSRFRRPVGAELVFGQPLQNPDINPLFTDMDELDRVTLSPNDAFTIAPAFSSAGLPSHSFISYSDFVAKVTAVRVRAGWERHRTFVYPEDKVWVLPEQLPTSSDPTQVNEYDHFEYPILAIPTLQLPNSVPQSNYSVLTPVSSRPTLSVATPSSAVSAISLHSTLGAENPIVPSASGHLPSDSNTRGHTGATGPRAPTPHKNKYSLF